MFSSSRPDFSSYAVAGGNMIGRAVKAALTNTQDYAGIANANKRAEGAVERQKIAADASLKALEIETETIKNVDKIQEKAINDVTNITKPYFTTKKTGTGLGLPIVTKIINEHNGSFSIKKSKDNKGTIVTISLPKYA